MDKLKKLLCSHRGHKGHMGKLLSTTQEIFDRLSTAKERDAKARLTDCDAILLAENLKQLQAKSHLFHKLDDKMIDAMDDEEKLEAAVFKAADLQTMLSEKIALIAHTLVTVSPLESPEVTTQKPTESNVQPSSNSPASSSNEEA